MNRTISATLLLLAITANTVQAQPRDAVEGLSGLPVPRYVSLSSGLANMRTGPGERYPVSWTYQRKGLPLKVVKEYGIWRKVVDPDGTTGWMHRNMTAGQRTAIVMHGMQSIHARPDEGSRQLWRVEPGVVGVITDCASHWCRFNVDGRAGYLRYEAIWGVDPNESFE